MIRHLLILIFVAAACGCGKLGVHRVYDGPSLPLTEVAVVKDSAGVHVMLVDGDLIGGKESEIADQYHLLPGSHRIEVFYSASAIFQGSWESLNLITFRHDFQAGHEYRFASKRESLGDGRARLRLELHDVTEGRKVADPSYGPGPPTFKPGQTGATIVGQASDGYYDDATGQTVYLVYDTPAVRNFLERNSGRDRFEKGWDPEISKAVRYGETRGYGGGFFQFLDVPPGKYIVVYANPQDILAAPVEVKPGQRLSSGLVVSSPLYGKSYAERHPPKR